MAEIIISEDILGNINDKVVFITGMSISIGSNHQEEEMLIEQAAHRESEKQLRSSALGRGRL